MTNEPKSVKKKSVLFLAWIVPIVALMISYGMIKEYYEKKGDVITVYVKDIKGLNIRKSHLEYKGVQIGKFLSIEPDINDINRFKIEIMLYSQFNYLVKKGSNFWVVSPKVSLDSVENIGTVLTGNYIELIPATYDTVKLKQLPSQNIFTALEKKPLDIGKIVEVSSKSGTLSKGASILYKGLKVGEVLEKTLLKSDEILYKVNLKKEYSSLISKNSYFFENTPLDIKLSMKEASLKLSPLKNFLHGSISLIIDSDIRAKKNNYIYESKEELYLDNKIIVLECNENFNLKKIFMDNEEVAKVVASDYNVSSGIKRVKIRFKDKYSYILKTDPKFYLVKNFLDIKKIDIKKIIEGDRLVVKEGIRKDLDSSKTYDIKVLDSTKKKSGFKLVIQGDSVKKDEGIYFKNIEIGYVRNVYLKDDMKFADLIIYHKYKKLINDSTQFYKIKDLKADFSLEGVSFELSSFRQMLEGGISFITYDKNKPLSDTLFELYDSKSEIEKLLKQKNYFFITLNLKDLYNLKTTSKLYLNNLQIGSVDKIYYDLGIKAKLKIQNRFKPFFGKGSKIYLEGIQLSLEKVKNISTEILGDRLHLIASKKGGFKNSFVLDSYNPIDTKYEKGLRVVIKHKSSKNISIKAPVYYKYFQIGIIEDIKLNQKTNEIESIVFIEDEYKKLVKDTSKFYETKIVDMELGLFSAKIKMGTVNSLLKGGIDLVNEKEFTNYAKNNDLYLINKYENKDK